MAVIQMGALITSIAGSVGGTTFTRGRNNIRLSNKSRGHRQQTSNSNAGLSNIQVVMAGWSALTGAVKAHWKREASNFTRLNKFGKSVTYTGRELYISVASNALLLDRPVLTPSAIINKANIVSITSFGAVAGGAVSVTLDGRGVFSYFSIQVQKIRSIAEPKPHKRYKKIAFGSTTDVTSINISSEVNSYLGQIQSGDVIQIFVTAINETLWTGVTQSQITTVV